jgi:hypothetical protein
MGVNAGLYTEFVVYCFMAIAPRKRHARAFGVYDACAVVKP